MSWSLSVAVVQWLSMQHASDILWCSTAVAVVAQTNYFASASYVTVNVTFVRCKTYLIPMIVQIN